MILDDFKKINLNSSLSKQEVVESIQKIIEKNNIYETVDTNFEKPWGAFWRFDTKDARVFADTFFSNQAIDIQDGIEFSPKFLLVAPEKRLSWQYHFRRSEIWRNISGDLKVEHSLSDTEPLPLKFIDGDFVSLQKEERHRLIGGNSWGLVAEIWQHTNPNNLSNEDDIVRVQDDFQR